MNIVDEAVKIVLKDVRIPKVVRNGIVKKNRTIPNPKT
jgi:hypothetical protein